MRLPEQVCGKVAALKIELQSLAHGLGFDLCRVARCEAPPHAAAFCAWLEAGRAGEMAWLERNQERRTNPFVHDA